MELARLLVRDDEATPVTCGTGNEYDGRMGVRISSIFVIMVGSMLGE
jgi:zinc transporter 1/2/3